MKQLEIENQLRDVVSRIIVQVELATSQGRTDINLALEDAFIPILKSVYNLPHLINLNRKQKNFPGIDLGDDHDRVAFQVTSTTTLNKVKFSVQQFMDRAYYNTFDELFMLMLSRKQSSYSQSSINELLTDQFTFNCKKHIIDLTDLLGLVSNLRLAAQERVLAEFRHILGEVDAYISFSSDSVAAPTAITSNLQQLQLPEAVYVAELTIDLRPLVGPKGQVVPYLRNVRRCLSLNADQEDFGIGVGLICSENGTVDIQTGELLPHAPEHQLRFKLNIAYDPAAACPVYDEHIRQTLRGDDAAVALFDEFAGLTLVPDLRYQKALYLVGPGGSGKSTLLAMLEAMHDPRAISVTPLDKIEDERYRADLAKKLVVMSSDIQTQRKVFGETFIRITGGDAVAIRKLYAEVDGFVRPTARFIGSMNLDMPPYIGAPDALERRLIFLPTGGKVAQPDPQRREKLFAERPGILARWISAYRRLHERGQFAIPQASSDEVTTYLHAHQPFDVFFDEELIVDPKADTPVASVGKAFNDWAEKHGERSMTTNVVGLKLRRLGVPGGYGKRREAGVDVTVRTVGVHLRRLEGTAF